MRPVLLPQHRGQAEERAGRDRACLRRQPQPANPVHHVAEQAGHDDGQQVERGRWTEQQRDRRHDEPGERHGRIEAELDPDRRGHRRGEPRVAQVDELMRNPPQIPDVARHVWDLWWVAHQLIHLGNPWFTTPMAAPVGIQLGFDTTMPLAGLIMSPVTLLFGPAAAFNLLTIVMPGLLCYVMYRVGRLWLPSQAGAIAAGAFFGLSSMLGEQDWAHLNIAAGTLFL